MKAKYAVIVAGGAGTRAGGDIPKQFRMLCGLPVLWWSVKAFYKQDPAVKIRIVMHPGFFDLWD
ncbi:MAG: 2-C-methyl-D-erythritol 4-phosphate cytidylyltransferase, partial [Muribaculaceae bacterium]|nr:2-C-methyl-D-erythritol 4-phosphate cytidylyltransferase [Muribaculaceae bacterium]